MCKKEKIKVRVHAAFFVNDKESVEHYFVNITNVAKHRQLTVTHLYFKHGTTVGQTLDIVPGNKKELLFPITLEPSECIEVPIQVHLLPKVVDPFGAFKVRDTDGNWYISKKQHTLATENVAVLSVAI